MRQRFGIAIALLGDPSLIIVDEPTAGLDPAERVRFLNLLSEIGENSVVILSTHIVEDVAELCRRMAIIDRGEILLEAEPLASIDALRSSVWKRVVAKSEVTEVPDDARRAALPEAAPRPQRQADHHGHRAAPPRARGGRPLPHAHRARA